MLWFDLMLMNNCYLNNDNGKDVSRFTCVRLLTVNIGMESGKILKALLSPLPFLDGSMLASPLPDSSFSSMARLKVLSIVLVALDKERSLLFFS